MKPNVYIGTCGQCSKRAYVSRSVARRVLRCARYDTKGMREYRCPHGIGWHIGHLPQAAVAGVKSAAKVYRRPNHEGAA